MYPLPNQVHFTDWKDENKRASKFNKHWLTINESIRSKYWLSILTLKESLNCDIVKNLALEGMCTRNKGANTFS